MGLLPMIPLGTYAICIDEVFILPQWMIVSLLRLRCLVPEVVWAYLPARCVHWHAHGQDTIATVGGENPNDELRITL
jgi:hypothetical protein